MARAMQTETDIRDALSHPVRRQILGALAGSPEGRSLAELTREVPGASVSAVSYHLRFLNGCGTVSPSATPWHDGTPTWRYGTDFTQPR